MRQVLDAVMDGVVVVDAAGAIDEVNSEACRILENSADALAGRPVEQLLGPDHAAAKLARTVLATGRAAIESDQAVERRFEPSLIADVAAAPLLDPAGKTEGVVLVLRDHTVRSALEAVISVAFRIAAARMLFTSDVMNETGHVVEKGTRLSLGTSLTPYLKVATRWSFVEYLDEVLLPYWNARRAELTRARLIEAGSLESIQGYLRRAEHIAVMTNADDMILAPGDIAFLQQTFGARATIYPVGGHCGNLAYRDNVAEMIDFFGGDPGQSP
ncbi:MAG: PAS domain-containing protein [Deltaproteobacteria bacterium]|nr:MAG: PAS domain-containing protein [Deltaproteobacteria bacterium]